MTTYPVPGRGAWTRTGGLLPAKPDTPGRPSSRAGYYRAPAVGEAPIGSAFIDRSDSSHHAEAVHLGVKAIQHLVGATVDGWFGVKTGAAVFAAQVRCEIEADGIVGRTTMRTLLTPLVIEIAAHNDVPAAILGGLVVHESALDPAAVGVNGEDHGIAQINLGAHGDTVSLAEAMDPDYALTFAAEDLSMTYDTWHAKTKADPWDIAIANHNSPALARRWARENKAPFVAGRVFQIEEYVTKVRSAW